MTKVLFVQIDSQSSAGYRTGLGIASISGYLKRRGFETSLVYYKTQNDYDYFLNKMEEFKPQLVGFYSTSIKSLEQLKD